MDIDDVMLDHADDGDDLMATLALFMDEPEAGRSGGGSSSSSRGVFPESGKGRSTCGLLNISIKIKEIRGRCIHFPVSV
jgi:hypothetical protein